MYTVCSDASPVYLEDLATKEPHSFGSSDESIVLLRHLSFDHLFGATDIPRSTQNQTVVMLAS
jgi:hypothetical protein